MHVLINKLLIILIYPTRQEKNIAVLVNTDGFNAI